MKKRVYVDYFAATGRKHNWACGHGFIFQVRWFHSSRLTEFWINALCYAIFFFMAIGSPFIHVSVTCISLIVVKSRRVTSWLDY